MLHHNQNSSLLTVSADPNFTPRREFSPDNHILSSFALLTIAGAGLIRLSSFSNDVVNAMFDFGRRVGLSAYREDKELKLYELELIKRPWANSRSINSEKLFLELLTIVLKHNYNYLSTIDYGKEHEDRLAIVFSRPNPSTPQPETGTGTNTLAAEPPQVRLPFALSFPSSTTLRVIRPPLNSTPAILQGVRSAWPRGVVSEKKVADDCFEFKLKGYGWFQEDTFSIDSLQHIMSLLHSLDQYAFTLLTSVSLSGKHTRRRDMWIFCGPPQDLPFESSTNYVDSGRRVGMNGAFDKNCERHSRTSSTPVIITPVGSQQATHNRSTTDPNPLRGNIKSTLQILSRRRTAAGVSTALSLSAPGMSFLSSRSGGTESQGREPSKCSVDMTGIGTGEGTVSKRGQGQKYNPDDFHPDDIKADSQNELASRSAVAPQYVYRQGNIKDDVGITSPILGAFRDSAFSSNTHSLHEIPIAWLDHLESDKFMGKMPQGTVSEHAQAHYPSIPENRAIEVHQMRGVDLSTIKTMNPTHMQGDTEEVYINDAEDEYKQTQRMVPFREPDPEKREVTAVRTVSPTHLEGAATRRSEAASISILRLTSQPSAVTPSPVASTSSPPVSPTSPESPTPISAGWVLINIDPSRAKTDPNIGTSSRRPVGNPQSNNRSLQPANQHHTFPSTSKRPITKVTAPVTRSIPPSTHRNTNPSGFKRLLSRPGSKGRSAQGRD